MQKNKSRSVFQIMVDFVTFPVRAVTLFHKDRWGLSALASERFDYVAREVNGDCLDVGCGRNNRFINEYLHGNGKGIDIFPYDGLTTDNIVVDLTHLEYEDAIFGTVTFIANVNHIPKSQRHAELREAYRVLEQNGKVVITMGNPLAEIAVHRLVRLYDQHFKTHYDMDSERGMDEEEAYYLSDNEITELLTQAGFHSIIKKYFLTQWGLNHLFVASKK